tara:strand:+ start:152 stop:403 length:252 start_codon:yes stop_codon:yes gene_type:complete
MKDPKDENMKRLVSLLGITVFVLMLCLAMSCSNVTTALEIPQHIQQRIMETENTYVIDVKYLVWNDIVNEYEWEYYSDFNYDL